MIKNVEIQNFKSIRELSFSCKRVNVFVGKPNVGKSNILEALSLYGAGYITSPNGFLEPFMRFNFVQELFYRKNVRNPIQVSSDLGTAKISFYNSDTYFLAIDPKKKLANAKFTNPNDLKTFFDEEYSNDKIESFELSPFFQIFNNKINQQSVGHNLPFYFYSPVKKYIFRDISSKPSTLYYPYSLVPPYGDNIVTILYDNRELLEFFAEIFKDEYNLELTIKDPEQILEVVIKEGLISYSTAINLTADTLQRIMFYLTAIKSNSNSILLLEEPEAHSFPTYTSLLADNIARSESNQFFITTHSPYLLRTLLDETPKDDLAIFITTYKDHQTYLHNLSEEEISELMEYDIDLFYNYKKFVD